MAAGFWFKQTSLTNLTKITGLKSVQKLLETNSLNSRSNTVHFDLLKNSIHQKHLQKYVAK
jgi:hypothetical protein